MLVNPTLLNRQQSHLVSTGMKLGWRERQAEERKAAALQRMAERLKNATPIIPSKQSCHGN